MWKRVKGWLSGGAGPANSGGPAAPDGAPRTVVTLRDLEIARQFPQELPDDATGPATGEPHACASCEGALEHVVITTGGPLGDPAVWEAYPLALDGWQCGQCRSLSYPAFLGPDQISALIDESIAAAQRGAFDEAEHGFRRAISSWPTYMPARLNFGSMCLDRIRAEQRGEARAEVVERYAQLAEHQLRKSLTCEPPPPPPVRFMLGKLLCRRGQRAEGAALLQQFLQTPGAPPRLREEAEALLAERSPTAR